MISLIKKNKKAQVAVLDLFIAAVIFGILVTMIMATWNNYNIKIDRQIEYSEMVIKAYHVSDLLSQYPGKLSAWEDYSLIQPLTLGLASEQGIIDQGKLDAFLDMDYDLTRDILNIKVYDYYFKLIHVNGSDFNPAINKGNETGDRVVSITRLVLYNGEEALLRFKLEK